MQLRVCILTGLKASESVNVVCCQICAIIPHTLILTKAIDCYNETRRAWLHIGDNNVYSILSGLRHGIFDEFQFILHHLESKHLLQPILYDSCVYRFWFCRMWHFSNML
ncbi:hypothetical protein RF11_04080 [Thelohanellus kitauei]|uniref:Uncharacterized protein n=1 Tax=Thelohanellus kitauei TaxID=669202 RepID=A0A0C2N6E1_THEKT|nr:hypothetical protein RF11_04080 [Thelohanellus kitauei]